MRTVAYQLHSWWVSARGVNECGMCVCRLGWPGLLFHWLTCGCTCGVTVGVGLCDWAVHVRCALVRGLLLLSMQHTMVASPL